MPTSKRPGKSDNGGPLELLEFWTPRHHQELLEAIHHTRHQLLERIDKMAQDLDSELATLNTTDADLVAAVNSATARLASLSDDLAKALAAAGSKGATPEQLAELEALNTSLLAEANTLNAAAAATEPAPPPPPPTGDTTGGTAGDDTLAGASGADSVSG